MSTLLSTTVLALTRENLSAWLLMRFAFYLAFSLTSILYLSLALWWKRSGQQHRRGSQLVDRGY
ncbi:MAG: hypothetical protein IPP88_09370 [Betaproteobacteria bacterium]|nr:hypothetical protein [Betaproteobacteria bacterium]